MPDPIQTPVLADPGVAVPDSSPAPAPAPVAAEAAPAGDSRPAPETGETHEQESKRLTDAQRKMHAATTEAAALRTENAELMQTLQAVLSDPQFAPIEVPAPQAPDPTGLKDVFAKYQALGAEDEAFAYLVENVEARAHQRVMRELQTREIRHTNFVKEQSQKLVVHNAITEAVKKIAPDITPRTFWAFTQAAVAETPPHLVRPVERLNWQAQRAIELAREEMGPRVSSAADSATQAALLARTAAAVMPAGASSSGPSWGGGAPGAGEPRTFVDAVRSLQDRKVPPG